MKNLLPNASIVAFAVCTNLTGAADVPQPEGQELQAVPASGATPLAQVGAKKRLTIEMPTGLEYPPPRACQI